MKSHVSILNRRTAVRLTALALALSVCLPAFAQRPRPERPYRGLFGGNGADPNSTQQLDLNISLFGAYDDNVLADRGQGGVDPRYQQSGGYGNSTLSLDYTKRLGRASFDFTGGTSYRYYPSIKEFNGFSYFASLGFSAKLGNRTTLNATESGSYMPFFTFSPFSGVTPVDPGTVAPIDPQQPLVNQAATMLSSTAALEHRLTPRNTLSADYSFAYADYQNRDKPFRNWAVGGQYRYRLSPRATLKLGYHFRRGTLGFYNTLDEPVDSHDLDVGVDYSRPLSRSRKTTVGFSTGSTIYRSVNTPAVPIVGPPSTADLYLEDAVHGDGQRVPHSRDRAELARAGRLSPRPANGAGVRSALLRRLGQPVARGIRRLPLAPQLHGGVLERRRRDHHQHTALHHDGGHGELPVGREPMARALCAVRFLPLPVRSEHRASARHEPQPRPQRRPGRSESMVAAVALGQ